MFLLAGSMVMPHTLGWRRPQCILVLYLLEAHILFANLHRNIKQNVLQGIISGPFNCQ